MFFEYNIPSRLKITGFNLKVSILNTNFSKLLYIQPDTRLTKDEFDNLYAEYSFNGLRDFLFIECEFEEIKGNLPKKIFRSLDEIMDCYNAPDYDVCDIARKFKSKNLPLRELSPFIRENYNLNVDNHHCEHYSKIAALVGDFLGYKCAAVTGYLNESDFKTVRIKSLGKTFTFPSFTGHKWTLLNKDKLGYIADPAVIPENNEKRFIKQISPRKDLEYSIGYIEKGSSEKIELYCEEYIEIIF